MSIIVTEKLESRRVALGPSPTAELRFNVRGTASDVAARVALEDETPWFYDMYDNGTLILPRDSVTVEPVGHELWEGVVRFALVPQAAESVFSFDTGGGTQHITQSLETVSSYVPTGATDPAPDYAGAIGATEDSIEGVDIAVPVYHFSETHWFSNAAITPAYKATLFHLTGKVNDAAWKGFEAGEVLFLGASGAKRGLNPWEITYRFAGSENKTGLTVGDITGINKKGWEYLWVRYADEADDASHRIVRRPIAAYVERVYEDGDFSALGIGST